ncbi:murein L,D-transpeptidase catalytic domain family protein [Cetobacterium sp.]|uniref:murein L,D-transpeptidase catalytic domain family protein n=1 Tax=Cetobacterium sp. TaxID=2071632 RepID=UPI003F319A36
MKKITIIFLCLFVKTFSSFNNYSIHEKLNSNNIKKEKKIITTNEDILSLYKEMKLKNQLDYQIFYNAILGLKKIKNVKNDIITIVDFTKSSLEERFYVLDLKKKKILFSTYVMHGKNSGSNIVTSFSNILNSYQSSPGFYKTESTYFGSFGYSLRIDGLEKGINDNARERAIVIHGSEHATPKKGATMLSRSLGCPAIPKELSTKIIEHIKNGRLLYIHTNHKEYVKKSNIIT